MRLASLALVIIATSSASSLAAQDHVGIEVAALSIYPLPMQLTPRQAPDGEGRSAIVLNGPELGGVTGMLVGAVVGGVYGGLVEEECVAGEECLSPGMKSMVFASIGGGLGGIIGVGMSYLLDPRGFSLAPPVGVSGDHGGGTRIGVSLRH